MLTEFTLPPRALSTHNVVPLTLATNLIFHDSTFALPLPSARCFHDGIFPVTQHYTNFSHDVMSPISTGLKRGSIQDSCWFIVSPLLIVEYTNSGISII